MESEDLEKIAAMLGKTVAKTLAEERVNFRVPEKQHFLDHEQLANCRLFMPEMEANHKFVKVIRESYEEVGKSTIKGTMKALGTLILFCMAYAIAKAKGLF